MSPEFYSFGIPEAWEPEIAAEATILIEEMARYGKCVATCELKQALGETATSIAAGQAEARLAVRAAAKAAAIAGKASTVYTMYGVIKCAVDCCRD